MWNSYDREPKQSLPRELLSEQGGCSVATAEAPSFLEPTDGEQLMARMHGEWRRMMVREVKAKEAFLWNVPRKISVATGAIVTAEGEGEANTHAPFPVTMVTTVQGKQLDT